MAALLVHILVLDLVVLGWLALMVVSVGRHIRARENEPATHLAWTAFGLSVAGVFTGPFLPLLQLAALALALVARCRGNRRLANTTLASTGILLGLFLVAVVPWLTFLPDALDSAASGVGGD